MRRGMHAVWVYRSVRRSSSRGGTRIEYPIRTAETSRATTSWYICERNTLRSLADGTPVEAVHSVYNGDEFEFRMSLVRSSAS